MKFKKPKLTYDIAKFDQSFYNQDTFNEHLNFHHNTYVSKLNSAIEPLGLTNSLTSLLQQSIFDSKINNETKTMIRNHGGGHYNHSLFWYSFSPEITEVPPELQSKIVDDFGSFEAFMEEFKKKSMAIFGSGWTFLVCKNNKLSIVNTANQDSPISDGYSCLMCIDIWEHAYYLVYKHDRKKFIDEWCKYINWKNVSYFYETYGKKNEAVEIEDDGSIRIPEI